MRSLIHDDLSPLSGRPHLIQNEGADGLLKPQLLQAIVPRLPRLIRLLITTSIEMTMIEARTSSKVGFSTCDITVVVVTATGVIVDEIVCTEDAVLVRKLVTV